MSAKECRHGDACPMKMRSAVHKGGGHGHHAAAHANKNETAHEARSATAKGHGPACGAFIGCAAEGEEGPLAGFNEWQYLVRDTCVAADHGVESIIMIKPCLYDGPVAVLLERPPAST